MPRLCPGCLDNGEAGDSGSFRAKNRCTQRARHPACRDRPLPFLIGPASLRT
jgi:hypothetical protein